MTDTEQPLTDEEFSEQLGVLLARADRDGVRFDRSWTVQAETELDLMVEITRVRSQKR